VFIGHFAVAFAAKKVAPKASLGTLIFAAAFLDAVWPVLVLLGVERFRIVPGFTAVNPFDFVHYPWSHSLLMTAVWSLLFALVYLGVKGDRAGALWVGIAVASHWVLDFVTHRPDLPLYPGGGERLGLDLWRSWPATFAVEGLMFAAAVALYTKTTSARDRTGAIAWWALVALLLLLYIPGPFSPPPPSESAVAVTGIAALLIFVPWGYWVDRHREPAAPAAAEIQALRTGSSR
jgi:LexA-binding, inner membrane-associated putative hydrolase